MSTINSKAKDISIALTAALATITKANGYRTDIGTKVSRGRPQLDENSIPLIVLVEGDETPEGRASPRSTEFKNGIEYRIEGFDICDLNNPNDIAHDIVADLKKCVFGKAVPLAFEVKYLNRIIGKREDGLKFNAGALVVAISYTEDVSTL